MNLDIRKLQGVIHRNGSDRLKRAYEAAEAPFREEIARIAADDAEMRAKVDAGQAEWSVTDDDGNLAYDFGDVLADRQFEADDALLTLRKAFAILVYHHWERSAQRWFTYPTRKPNHGHFVCALKSAGYSIDEAGLSELNQLVNCLKHDSTSSGPELYQKRPDLFEPEFDPNPRHPLTGEPFKKIDWANHVVLTDAHLKAFFEVVRSSAQSRHPYGGIPTEACGLAYDGGQLLPTPAYCVTERDAKLPTEPILIDGRLTETLPEYLRPGLRAVFVGLNPSPVSVAAGHYYQGKLGRRFWVGFATTA